MAIASYKPREYVPLGLNPFSIRAIFHWSHKPFPFLLGLCLIIERSLNSSVLHYITHMLYLEATKGVP